MLAQISRRRFFQCHALVLGGLEQIDRLEPGSHILSQRVATREEIAVVLVDHKAHRLPTCLLKEFSHLLYVGSSTSAGHTLISCARITRPCLPRTSPLPAGSRDD